jgi:hypothetical protein
MRLRECQTIRNKTAAPQGRSGMKRSRLPISPLAMRTPANLQPKLTVNPPGDRYEQEADRTADQVMQMPTSNPVTKQEDRAIQAKESSRQTPRVTPALEARLVSSRGRGEPLLEVIRTFMESRFEHDFGGVRIHRDAGAIQMNRELKAQAFTHQQDVYFGAGKYIPETGEGKRLLAHELTHVVQQTGGIRGKLIVERPENKYEQEADRISVKAMSISSSLQRQEAPPAQAVSTQPMPTQQPQQQAGQLSGAAWVAQFPGSRSVNDLAAGFRENVQRFLEALTVAGATHTIQATLRPPERAYLMHYSYRVANGLDPQIVPARPRVNINWVHHNAQGQVDLPASRAAAQEMVNSYQIAYAPALQTRHTEGRAIDMTITWSGNLEIRNAAGENVTISSTPRTGAGNTDLHTIGQSYGVIKLVSDPPHWSDDGH